MSLATLRSHLFTLNQVKSDLILELVPSVMGDHVLLRKSVWGKTVCQLSKQKNLSLDLKANLQKIRDLFYAAILYLQSQNAAYFEILTTQIISKSRRIANKDPFEENILEFCMYLNPVIKQFLKGLEPPYIVYLCDDTRFPMIRNELICAKLVQKIKNFELSTNTILPARALYKLSINKELKVKEQSKIDAWLKGIKAHASRRIQTITGTEINPYVKVRFFHRFLKSLIEAFKRIIPGERANLVTLEMHLCRLGCDIFEQPDPELIALRKRIIPGISTITLNEKSYTFGDVLNNSQLDPHLPLIFEASNDPSCVIVLDKNEVFRSLKNDLDAKFQYGLILPQVVNEDPTGGLTILERCYYPLSEIQWRSEGEILADEDLIYARPIVELLRGLNQQPFTPFPLVVESFCFNVQDEMRVMHTMDRRAKSFEAIETFAWECAKNNNAVFTHLMHAGKLVSAIDAEWYHSLAKRALKNKDRQKAVTMNETIEREDIVKMRTDFFIGIQQFQKALFEKLSVTYHIEDRFFKRSLDRIILNCRMKHCPGSLFITNFFEKCIEAFLSIEKPKMQWDFLFPLQKEMIAKIAAASLGLPKTVAYLKSESFYRQYGIFNKEQQLEIFNKGLKQYGLSNKISF